MGGGWGDGVEDISHARPQKGRRMQPLSLPLCIDRKPNTEEKQTQFMHFKASSPTADGVKKRPYSARARIGCALG